MVQNFNIAKIDVSERDRKIILHFSLDIDPETVDGTSVFVSEAGSTKQPAVKIEKEVKGRDIEIHVPDMKVNTNYEVTVTPEMKSITMLPLATKFRRRIRINSAVDSSVQILSPADFEDVEERLQLILKETPGESGKLFGSFEVQIASEPGFYDILHSMNVSERSSLSMVDIKFSEQYFIRARAVNEDGDFGNWSPKVAFTFSKGKTCKCHKEDDGDPIFVKDLNVIAVPDAGKTPESFIIVFDHDLDPASIDPSRILLLRKQV